MAMILANKNHTRSNKKNINVLNCYLSRKKREKSRKNRNVFGRYCHYKLNTPKNKKQQKTTNNNKTKKNKKKQ